jgi:hypothetical protein
MPETAPVALKTDREPWERQPGESEQAFGAWTQYMLMDPPRSLRRVGQELGKSHQLLDRWSPSASVAVATSKRLVSEIGMDNPYTS